MREIRSKRSLLLRRYMSATMFRMHKFGRLPAVVSFILCLPALAETHWLTAAQFAEKISAICRLHD